MSVSDVKNTFKSITADRRIDVKDVDTILSSAGSISADEAQAIKEQADQFSGMMDPAAKKKLNEALGEIASLRTQAASINKKVEISQTKLNAEVKDKLTVGKPTTSFGGTPIPEAVKTALHKMMDAGAIAYDVREMKADPVYDTSHGDPELTLDGKYNPYSQSQKAVDSMAFSYTELTPAGIEKDMTTPQTFNVQAGYKDVNGNQEATFEKKTMTGNGRITELYDEATWGDTFARGPGGQKYASNFAILADGSFHAVPASRRTKAEPWRILTTASLARDKQMLFNGHIHMENGVVNYVGMSGRLCKLQDKGTKFVDPIELLKAWGFKMTPGLTVTNEG